MNNRVISIRLSTLALIIGALLLAGCAGNLPFSATAPAKPTATMSGPIPAFMNPTNITNPYFPVSSISQTISLGKLGSQSSRRELTLMPDLQTITWGGGNTQARIVQWVVYADGKLVKVVYDYLAQADNGDVYVLGEDLSNYKDGQVANHDGSWLMSKDGAPPGLLIPAQPHAGMVFHPANLPGTALETDEVQSLSEKTTTPKGPVGDGLLIKATLMDGSIENRVWAAGFGIVEDRFAAGKVTLVLLNRADSAPRSVPDPLQTIEAQAEAVFDVLPGGKWTDVQKDVAAAGGAWKAYQPQAATDGAPQVFLDALAAALDRLQEASSASDEPGTLQAANDLSAAVMDLYSVYQPVVPADLGRLDVLERQVGLDVAKGDFAAVANTLATADAIWARVKPSAQSHNGSQVAAQFDASLAAQRKALTGKDAGALTDQAQNGLELVDGLEKLY